MRSRSDRKALEHSYAFGGSARERTHRARRRKYLWRKGWERRWLEENAYCGSCSHSESVRAKAKDGGWPVIAGLVHCIPNDCLCMFEAKPCEMWEWPWR